MNTQTTALVGLTIDTFPLTAPLAITDILPPTKTTSSTQVITALSSDTTSSTNTTSSPVTASNPVTTSSPATPSNHSSANKHKGIPVGLVAGVVVVVLFVLSIIIYSIRKWRVINIRQQRGEKSLTIIPLSLPPPSEATSWSLPTSKQSRRMRENETIRLPESAYSPLDSSQTEKEQDEREEGVSVDAARVEANSTATAEIERRGIVFSDAHNNLIPRPVVDAEMQIADLQQQVQMIQGILHLLSVGRDDVGYSLASSMSEPPPEYAPQSGSE